MYNLNGTMSDFLKDLAKVLNDYNITMEVNENDDIQFVSYEHDFVVTSNRFSEGIFENCSLTVDLVTFKPEEVEK